MVPKTIAWKVRRLEDHRLARAGRRRNARRPPAPPNESRALEVVPRAAIPTCDGTVAPFRAGPNAGGRLRRRAMCGRRRTQLLSPLEAVPPRRLEPDW